jgi:Mg2+-importing ATPase
MIVFGLVSSAFDFLAFGTLLFVLDAGEESFRTGWFLVSVLTELAILLVIRTRRRFFRSPPSRQLLVAALAIAAATIALPFTPVAPLLGLVALDWHYMLAVFGIVGLYTLVSEVTKAFVFRHLA